MNGPYQRAEATKLKRNPKMGGDLLRNTKDALFISETHPAVKFFMVAHPDYFVVGSRRENSYNREAAAPGISYRDLPEARPTHSFRGDRFL
jgi:hypothetical protein